MASRLALLAILVGVVLVAVAASMWSRTVRATGDEAEATVVDASVVETKAFNASHAVDVTCEYRYDADRYETQGVVHPRSLSGTDHGGPPDVPDDYRAGATVTVDVPPERPGDAAVPDPGVRATYRFAVPAIAAVGGLVTAVGAWLAL